METGLKRNRLFQFFLLDTWAVRVGEGRAMTKPRGLEDFSSSNCQVPFAIGSCACAPSLILFTLFIFF